MARSYPLGSNVRCSVIYKSVPTGAYVDPTTVTFRIRTPESGAVTTYVYVVDPEVVKDSVGHYHVDYTADYPGDWWYRWEAAGNYIGASENYFCIWDTRF